MDQFTTNMMEMRRELGKLGVLITDTTTVLILCAVLALMALLVR